MGRGACTTFAGDMANADWVMIEGSNMAECHPIAFRWVMQAKLKGAKVIHVDPRFTRTSAMADIYAPIRAGADIAFLGGLINYTNAPIIVGDDFKDTEDLEGVFSGLMQNTDPAQPQAYNPASWGYKRSGSPPNPAPATSGPPYDDLVKSLVPAPAQKDMTLQDPRSVFQIVKRHYSRYTPEMVERVTGVPRDVFLKIAQII